MSTGTRMVLDSPTPADWLARHLFDEAVERRAQHRGIVGQQLGAGEPPLGSVRVGTVAVALEVVAGAGASRIAGNDDHADDRGRLSVPVGLSRATARPGRPTIAA